MFKMPHAYLYCNTDIIYISAKSHIYIVRNQRQLVQLYKRHKHELKQLKRTR